MDVAVVLAGRNDVFHYSPLKLAEYLAAGRAVVAPDVPQISARLTSGVDAVLVPPGDTQALAGAIAQLHDEPELRRAIARGGHEAALDRFSWDGVVRRIVAKLEDSS